MPLLEVKDLSKRFGGVQALDDVSLNVSAGTIHALCGANGAGKSTLIRILAGVEQPDSGAIRLEGADVTFSSPSDAQRLGMTFLHQELNLVPKFSVVANMSLGYSGAARLGYLRRQAVRDHAGDVLGRLGADIPLDIEVERLSVSDRWMVSLARALMNDARLIALDEPTASFTDAESERLFVVLRDLAASGVAVLYISHRLDEILSLASEVTVFRDGHRVGTYDASSVDRDALARLIVGRQVDQITHHAPIVDERPSVLSVGALTRHPRVRGVDLEVREGEILGLAGLAGSGRTELARLLCGADRPTGGRMALRGRRYEPRSPYDAIRRGVALVPEERRSQALLLNASVARNITLARPERRPGRARRVARDMVHRFGIKVASVETAVSALSGGNQQKVVLSRQVLAAPSLLVLDEPTVGVDVGARGELHRIIAELSDAGTSVIIISSDFDELGGCDRVAVMRDGRIAHIVDGANATKDTLTKLCYGEKSEGT